MTKRNKLFVRLVFVVLINSILILNYLGKRKLK